jgi:hypothetical protein
MPPTPTPFLPLSLLQTWLAGAALLIGLGLLAGLWVVIARLRELRADLRRLEDAWLVGSQAARLPEAPERVQGAPANLGERVVNRLLALGYERVRLITSPEDLAALAAEPRGGNGEITVEARRDGALCKGRVLLRSGALTEVEIRPSYSVFP